MPDTPENDFYDPPEEPFDEFEPDEDPVEESRLVDIPAEIEAPFHRERGLPARNLGDQSIWGAPFEQLAAEAVRLGRAYVNPNPFQQPRVYSTTAPFTEEVPPLPTPAPTVRDVIYLLRTLAPATRIPLATTVRLARLLRPGGYPGYGEAPSTVAEALAALRTCANRGAAVPPTTMARIRAIGRWRQCLRCQTRFVGSAARRCQYCDTCPDCVAKFRHYHCGECDAAHEGGEAWQCPACRRATCCVRRCEETVRCTRLPRCQDCCTEHIAFRIQDGGYRVYPAPRPDPPPYKPFLYLGVELEVECGRLNRETVARKVYEKHGEELLIKHDGSLSNGFEAVTGPMSLEEHQKFWPQIVPDLTAVGARSWRASTTGLHVHISRDWVTTLALGKMLAFITSEQTRRPIIQLAGRESPNYAAMNKKKISDGLYRSWKIRYKRSPTAYDRYVIAANGQWITLDQGFNRGLSLNDAVRYALRYSFNARLPVPTDADIAAWQEQGLLVRSTEQARGYARYEALNLSNDNTLEFRLFKGTLHLEHILADVEFCHALAHWARDASLRDVESWPVFWSWVLKQGHYAAPTSEEPQRKGEGKHPYRHLIHYVTQQTPAPEVA